VPGFFTGKAKIGNLILAIAGFFQNVTPAKPKAVGLVRRREERRRGEGSFRVNRQGVKRNVGGFTAKEGGYIIKKDTLILKGKARHKIAGKSAGKILAYMSETPAQSFVRKLRPNAINRPPGREVERLRSQ